MLASISWSVHRGSRLTETGFDDYWACVIHWLDGLLSLACCDFWTVPDVLQTDAVRCFWKRGQCVSWGSKTSEAHMYEPSDGEVLHSFWCCGFLCSCRQCYSFRVSLTTIQQLHLSHYDAVAWRALQLGCGCVICYGVQKPWKHEQCALHRIIGYFSSAHQSGSCAVGM